MEDTLINVERLIFDNLRAVDAQCAAIAQQRAELERSRRGLRQCLRVVWDEYEPAAVAASSREPSVASAVPRCILSAIREVGEQSAYSATSTTDRGDDGGEKMANSPTPVKESVAFDISHVSTHPVRSPSATLLSLFNTVPHDLLYSTLHDAHLSHFTVQTQALHTRVAQYRENSLLHAAKLEFAEEWTRVALPWFNTVVMEQFFLPLQRRLTKLESRLARLTRRLCLDLPQYTLRRPDQTAEEAHDARGKKMFPLALLWGRYLHAMDCRPATRTGKASPSSLPLPNSSLERCGGSADNEEEVVVAPPPHGDTTELHESLPHRRRSLRHIWHVMRYGLLGGGGAEQEEEKDEACAGDAVRYLPEEAKLCALPEGNEGGDFLASRVRGLLAQYTALYPRFCFSLNHSPAGSVACSLRDNSKGIADKGAYVASGAFALLRFLERVFVLRDTLHADKSFASCRGSSSSVGVGECPEEKKASLAQLTLLPFHLLRPSLQPILEAPEGADADGQDDAHCDSGSGATPALLPTTAAAMYWKLNQPLLPPLQAFSAGSAAEYLRHINSEGDSLLSFLRWWCDSSSACDCRHTYARLLLLEWIYGRSPPRESIASCQRPLTASSSSSSSLPPPAPPLAAEARLYRLREAEAQMRGQWQELQTRLLVARSLRSRADRVPQ